MAKVVVLKQHLSILSCLALCLSVTACSTLNTSSKPAVVPVKTDTKSQSTKKEKSPKALNIFKPPPPKAPANAVKETQDIATMEESKGKNKADISSLLLEKADKAKAAQQWLRAQRILEQAIRIDAKNPIIFMSYGGLYEMMGINEKAVNMYKRALYLSKDQSKLKEQIREIIDALEN